MRREWHNDQWAVATAKAPILDSRAMDAAEKNLSIPMPEIVFGNNVLELSHRPSGATLRFTCLGALDRVDKTGTAPGMLQLAHSAKWKGSKQTDYKVHRPFDWTYTTDYSGEWTNAGITTTTGAAIPFEKLRQPAPILFFDEVPLYEDELGDFGLTSYSVKVRVMPENMLILARMYMRVDDVAFRVRDTRVYVDFGTNEVIVEYVEREDSFQNVRAHVTAPDFTHQLRNFDWVASVLPETKHSNYTVTLDSAAPDAVIPDTLASNTVDTT